MSTGASLAATKLAPHKNQTVYVHGQIVTLFEPQNAQTTSNSADMP